MLLYSEKYSKVGKFDLATYDEVVQVEGGYAEVHHPNSIRLLMNRRGFVEVKKTEEEVQVEEPEVETVEGEEIETAKEEVPVEESEVEIVKEKEMPILVEEQAEQAKSSELTVGDVDVLTSRTVEKKVIKPGKSKEQKTSRAKYQRRK